MRVAMRLKRIMVGVVSPTDKIFIQKSFGLSSLSSSPCKCKQDRTKLIWAKLLGQLAIRYFTEVKKLFVLNVRVGLVVFYKIYMLFSFGEPRPFSLWIALDFANFVASDAL